MYSLHDHKGVLQHKLGQEKKKQVSSQFSKISYNTGLQKKQHSFDSAKAQ